jgi:hypothetical protein
MVHTYSNKIHLFTKSGNMFTLLAEMKTGITESAVWVVGCLWWKGLYTGLLPSVFVFH